MGIKKELDEIEITCPFCGTKLNMFVFGSGSHNIAIQGMYEMQYQTASNYVSIETFCNYCHSKINIETQGIGNLVKGKNKKLRTRPKFVYVLYKKTFFDDCSFRETTLGIYDSFVSCWQAMRLGATYYKAVKNYDGYEETIYIDNHKFICHLGSGQYTNPYARQEWRWKQVKSDKKDRNYEFWIIEYWLK